MRRRWHSRHTGGFTLVELLVALAAMALLAMASWQGLDGMMRAQSATRERDDAVVTLQTALSQWSADLDASASVPGTRAMDWDGRMLRITRRSAAGEASAMRVVAWTVRNGADGPRWWRWQSPALRTQGEWRQAWALAAGWSQDGTAEARTGQTVLMPVESWQVQYFRGNAWVNALPAEALGTDAAVPDGVRLVLTLPPGPALTGTLIRDWVRPTLAQPKS